LAKPFNCRINPKITGLPGLDHFFFQLEGHSVQVI
jgi:hypothetical protein